MMAVETEVRYLDPRWRGRDEVPSIGDRESRRANTAKYTVRVHDVRDRLAAGQIDLDVNGFTLLRHASGVADFRDDAEVRAVYYPELEALAKRTTGALEIFFIQHVVRTEDKTDFNKAYARFVHCDYGLKGPREASRRLLEKRGRRFADYAAREFAWFNTWQPFDNEVRKNPLAVIDASTLAGDDVVDYYYTGFKNRPGATLERSAMPVHNPAHRFYYVSRMATDELLFIKQLDTRAGVARACPHTSFDDPTSPPEAPPRHSIEVRMLATFQAA